MDDLEITQDLINYLNAMGQYQTFLDWMVDRGSDREELEDSLNKIEES